MHFNFSKSFARSLKHLHPSDKVSIQRQVDIFMLAIDVRQIPSGFGLKKLRQDLWEFRTDLAYRVLFVWNKDTITFLFAGNHNEVRQFLKYY